MTVSDGTDDQGNIKYVQQKVYMFASLPVLYNLMVNEKYKDAIQVYNQMVLFYSSDGQMFLIKPTAAIDSNTRFSIQYFNKSANDILLNYKDYIQDRLTVYGINETVTDADIKVTANINYIKVFYNAYKENKDGTKSYLITYILIYDVLNNRYYTYDTLAFNKINSIHYIPDGEMYITEYNNQLYFTMPHINLLEYDNNTDKSYYDNFSPLPINCELDTGTINLNNHLKKRFKELRIIYKNLNSNNLEFKLETFIDDVPIITYVDHNLEIQNISGCNTLTTIESNKVTQLVQELSLINSYKVTKLLESLSLLNTAKLSQLINNIALFDFSEYSSNKIITHKTNIISKGKSIRIKMNFTSKGKYKIQGFGLIYKEHTI
jgi:hypothetical protein